MKKFAVELNMTQWSQVVAALQVVNRMTLVSDSPTKIAQTQLRDGIIAKIEKADKESSGA